MRFRVRLLRMCLITITSHAISSIDGEFIAVYGTSSSLPVVGSMITLIIDARLAVYKSPAGQSSAPFRISAYLLSSRRFTPSSRLHQSKCKSSDVATLVRT